MQTMLKTSFGNQKYFMLIRESEGIYSPKNKVLEINIHFIFVINIETIENKLNQTYLLESQTLLFMSLIPSPEFKTETKTVQQLFENNYAKAYDMDTY